MSRAASLIQRLLDEEQHQNHSAIQPDSYQVDLGRRYDAASNAVKIMYRDYMYHLDNLMDAIRKKVTYSEQMEKYQLQKHSKEDYEHALKALQQIAHREFAQYGQ